MCFMNPVHFKRRCSEFFVSRIKSVHGTRFKIFLTNQLVTGRMIAVLDLMRNDDQDHTSNQI